MKPSIVAMLLLVPLLMAAMPGMGQGEGFAITRFAITGETPQWINGTPNTTTLEVRVHNSDVAVVPGYTLSYFWVPEDEEGEEGDPEPLNGDTLTSTDVGGPLAPGEERIHTATWVIHGNQKGNGTLEVQANGDDDSFSTHRTIRLFVPDRLFHLDWAGLNVSRNLTIHPQETIFLTASVENQGNAPEEFHFRPRRVHERLHAFVEPANVTVPAGRELETTFYIQYPFGGDSSPFNSTAKLQVASLQDPWFNSSIETPRINSSNDPVSITNDFILQRTDAGTRFADPGSDTKTRLRITNTGSSNDTFHIEVSVTDGWHANSSRNFVALPSGNHTFFEVHATAPASGVPGAPATLSVVVRSENRPDVSKTEDVPLRVTGPAIVVDSVKIAGSLAYIGDQAEAVVAFLNVGNRPQDAGTHGALDVRFPDGDVQSFSGELASIAAGTKLLVRYAIGTLSTPGEGSMEASWSLDGGGVAHSLQTPFLVRSPDILLEAARPLAGLPQETVLYRAGDHIFRITNRASEPETLLLKVNAEHGHASIDGQERLQLQPQETRLVPVSHALPSGNHSADVLNLEATIAARPRFSWINTTVTRIDDDLPPDFTDHTIPPAWTVGVPLNLSVQVQDGGLVANVSAFHFSPDKNTTTLWLQPGADDWWNTTVNLGVLGNHSFALRAKDGAGNRASGPAVAVQVVPAAPPDLTWVYPRAGENASQDRAIHVVAHGGGARVSHGTIQIDQQQPLPLNFSLNHAYYNLSAVAIGEHDVIITATNALGSSATLEGTIQVVAASRQSETEPPGNDTPVALWIAVVALVVATRRRR